MRGPLLRQLGKRPILFDSSNCQGMTWVFHGTFKTSGELVSWSHDLLSYGLDSLKTEFHGIASQLMRDFIHLCSPAAVLALPAGQWEFLCGTCNRMFLCGAPNSTAFQHLHELFAGWFGIFGRRNCCTFWRFRVHLQHPCRTGMIEFDVIVFRRPAFGSTRRKLLSGRGKEPGQNSRGAHLSNSHVSMPRRTSLRTCPGYAGRALRGLRPPVPTGSARRKKRLKNGDF